MMCFYTRCDGRLGGVNSTINLFDLDSIRLVIEAMGRGEGGNVTINWVEGGHGREEVRYEQATINRGRRKSCNNFLQSTSFDLDSIRLVIEAMGGGGNVTIIGVEGGQGREDTTINWWRTRQIPTYFESCWKVLQSVLSLY
jgi:hypothetical protein